MVTGRNKTALENHFDRHTELERILSVKGDLDRLASINSPTELAHLHYLRQGEALGLGHAVSVARTFVGDDPFAVLLPDDLIDAHDPVLPTMLDVRARYGGSVLAVMEVPETELHLYGCPAVELTDDENVLTVTGLVEKPAAGKAPSKYAVIGRYVLDPAVFSVLENTAPGKGGEVQLTDALATLAGMPASAGGGVHAVVFRGSRYDTGDKLSYLQAVIRIASQRDDLGPGLRSWLREFTASLNE